MTIKRRFAQRLRDRAERVRARILRVANRLDPIDKDPDEQKEKEEVRKLADQKRKMQAKNIVEWLELQASLPPAPHDTVKEIPPC